MTTLRRLLLISVALLMTSQAAEARHHHHRQHRHHAYHHHHHKYQDRVHDRGQQVAHPVGCPRTLFCGCGVSVYIYGHPIRNLFAARAYYKFPHDVNGNVAIINPHHVVAIIQNYGDGTALVYDPNNGGHRTRIHRRNIAGATIVRAGSHGSYAQVSLPTF